MVIIVGLGNPGFMYQNTFHNMGYKTVDNIAKKLGITFSKEKYKAAIAEGRYAGNQVMLVKPTTFMNNSGECVAMLKKKFKDARIIVVVDDIDLAKGVIRYRENGSSGTHNGMRSIVSYIGQDFERVRIGIGRDEGRDLADYVLSNVKEEDKALFEQAFDKAAELILEKIS
jgi:PTH1 family peptidyl-tRNA hydrolase